VEHGPSILASGVTIDRAVLDINLRGQFVFEVADALVERGIPFVFVTGYERASVPDRFADVAMFQKPVDSAALCAVILH
jgi:two-component SAPR family response regulator